MDNDSSDGESVVTNTTVGSAVCSPRHIFKGLNMLHVDTQELVKLVDDERCYSPMIPSQFATALSQFTEPLFSDMTDNESSCSQSLLITDVAKHTDQDELIYSVGNNLNHQISEDIKQPSNDSHREAEILSGRSQLLKLHDKPNEMGIGQSYPALKETEENKIETAFNENVKTSDMLFQSQLLLHIDKPDLVGVNNLPSSLKEVAESQTDSDATRLETDVEVSPSQDTNLLELQVNHFCIAMNHTGYEANSAPDNDSHDASFSQITVIVPSLDSEFTQPLKNKTDLCTQDNMNIGFNEQKPLVFRKETIAREASIIKSSFVPPFKKVCRRANQKVQDNKTSNTCITNLPRQPLSEHHSDYINSNSNIDIHMNLQSTSDCFSVVHSSNCQLSKVSQALTSVMNDVEQSQVSSISSKSLFSSSVPSESQASKPSDHTADPTKCKSSEGHAEFGVLGEHIGSISGTTGKNSTSVSHNSIANETPEQFQKDHLMTSVSYDPNIGPNSGESKNDHAMMLKQYSGSPSSVDRTNSAASSDNKLTKDVDSTKDLANLTKQLEESEDKSENRSKHIHSQKSCCSDQAFQVKPSTASPSGSNRNKNYNSSLTDKSVCSISNKKTLHVSTQSSHSSSITKSPQSKGSSKMSSRRKSKKSPNTIISSETNCKSNFTTACKILVHQHDGMDTNTRKAESKENTVAKARNQPRKLSIPTADLPDHSEKTQLIKMVAQYAEMGKMLQTRHIDKSIFAQRVKGLQMKILKFSECHKQERANMTAKLQCGVLSKLEKHQLKSDMQCLAERQKLLVEIVKKHKDVNTKLKSVSVVALSGSSVNTPQGKSSTILSGQVPSSSQTSSDSKFKATSAENILGDGNNRFGRIGIITSKSNLSSVDEKAVQFHKHLACSELKSASEGIVQSNGSVLSDNLQLLSNAKKSKLLVKQVIDLTDNAEGSMSVKIPQMSVSSSIHNSKSITGTSSDLNNNREKTRDSLKSHEKLQSTMAATTAVKAHRELTSKISLNENSQKILDDIFFTDRNETCQYDKTEVTVNSKLENKVTNSLITSGQKWKDTCSETEISTGHKLTTGSSMQGQHVTVNTDSDGTHSEIQVHAVSQLTSMPQGMQCNSDVNCKGKPVSNLTSINSGNYVNIQQICTGNVDLSTQTSNQSEAVQKAASQVIILDAQKLSDQTCKQQIQDHTTSCSSIQLKKCKMVDKNGNILDVFIMQNPSSTETAAEIHAHTDVSKSLNDLAKLIPPVFDSREVPNAEKITGVSFNSSTKCEIMLKNSVDLSPSKPVSNDVEQNTNIIVSHDEQSQCSKMNNQSPCQVIPSVCQSESVFKSPQIVPTAETTTTTSPCSTAVSSDVFPVSCTELARRMKTKAIKQLQSSCPAPNSNTVKIIKVTPAEKTSVTVDQGNLAAKTLCLKDLVNAGLVKPGRHVLSVNTKNGKVWADVTNGGLIRGRESKIFRTPCAWMSTITGCVAKKKTLVYQQIHYLNKPLCEYIKELTRRAQKTEVKSGSSVTRLSHCPTDRSGLSRPVKVSALKDTLFHPVPESLDLVAAQLLQTLCGCTVKLIDDAEIVHCPDLTTAFWSADFTTVNMSKTMWASVDCWG